MARGLGLIAGIAIARILGTSEYGEYGLIRNAVLTAGTVIGYGLSMTLTKHVAALHKTRPSEAARVILLSFAVGGAAVIALTCAVLLAAPHIGRGFNLEEDRTLEATLAGVMFAAHTFWQLMQAGLAGFQAFRKLALNSAVYGVTVLLASFVLASAFGLRGALLAQVMCAILGACLALWVFLRECRKWSIRFSERLGRTELRVLWDFSLPAYLSGIVVMPITFWSLSIVSTGQDGLTAVGLFSAADQWRTLALFLPQAIGSVVLPLLSEAAGASSPDRYRRLLWSSLVVNVGACSVLSLVLIVASPSIVHVYGPGFESAMLPMILLLLAAVPQSAAAVLGQALASRSKMWWALLLNGIWAIVLVTCVLVVFDRTAIGLSLSILAAYAVQGTVSAATMAHFTRR